MKKRMIALLCALMLLALTACVESGQVNSNTSTPGNNTPVSSAEPTTVPTAVPTATPAATPAATPTPEATPTPVPDEPVSSEEHHALPPVDTEDPEFADAFAKNSIDADFLVDSEDALTTLEMIELFNTYVEKWEEQIDSLYVDLLAKTKDGTYGEDAYDTIKAGQEEWVDATPAALDALRAEKSGAGSGASLNIASAFMEYYRSRAAELSSIYFQMTGEIGIG